MSMNGPSRKQVVFSGALFLAAVIVKASVVGGGAVSIAISVTVIVAIFASAVLVEHYRNR